MQPWARTIIWASFTVGGIIYQLIKFAFGLEVKPMQAFDSSCWSGAALLLHWWDNRDA